MTISAFPVLERGGVSLARELRDQADFDEAESVFGGGSRTRELMREAADALHAGAEERGE